MDRSFKFLEDFVRKYNWKIQFGKGTVKIQKETEHEIEVFIQSREPV